jgi:tetratricopeptide (TPR) repeat protein
VRNNLAAALLDAGRMDRAESLFVAILADEPIDRRAGLGYVRLLKEMGRLDEARDVASRLAADYRDDPDVLTARASVAQASGDMAAAERDFRRATSIDAAHVGARAGHAELMDWTGRYAEGLASLGLSPQDEPAPITLMRARLLGRLGRDEEALAALSGLEARGLGDVGLRRRLAFLEGELLERLGRYEEALACLVRGNGLNPVAWAPAPPESPVPPAPAGHEAGTGIVFVVGMPRSGTTLLEQMLAGHPQVTAGGERAELGMLARDPAVRKPDLTAAEADSLARRYLADPPCGGRVFTDKMPMNYLHLPVAARLLPRARVLHCMRDARDVAVSCFSQDFIDPALGFARRWDWLASALADYRRRMARWTSSPGLPTHTVRYEALVENPQKAIGRVLNFLDLAPDPACLKHLATDRTAHTASHAQVRRPVYTSSVGRWRRFEPWLPPDIIALEPDNVAL